MTTDEYGLLSMSDIDPVDLRMSSRRWELQGLVPSGKALDHVSMYGSDLSDEENAENMQPVPKAYRKCCVKCKMKCSHLKLTQRML